MSPREAPVSSVNSLSTSVSTISARSPGRGTSRMVIGV
jgi:hypothetical protein